MVADWSSEASPEEWVAFFADMNTLPQACSLNSSGAGGRTKKKVNGQHNACDN